MSIVSGRPEVAGPQHLDFPAGLYAASQFGCWPHSSFGRPLQLRLRVSERQGGMTVGWREIMYGQQYAETQDVGNVVEAAEPDEDIAAPASGEFPPVERPPGEEDGNPPPGWYTDPRFSEKQRYWDGDRWINPKPTGRANRLAVAAFICACLAGFIAGGVLGIVLGVVALDEIRESEGRERGEGLAQWAIGLGVLNLAISALFVALVIRALTA
jgi:Domain of unknown function (DUF4190)/Protein of unknown function (DUF2510)